MKILSIIALLAVFPFVVPLVVLVILLVIPLAIPLAILYWEGYRLHFKWELHHPEITEKESTQIKSPVSRTYNPPDFDKCPRLQNILQDVRSHILKSPSTRSLYVIVCEIFFRHLDDPQGQEPSDENVNQIFSLSWPSFVPLAERLLADEHLGWIWGQTDKKSNLSELQLNPDMIVALERAPEGSDLLIILHTLLVITIFHELCHYVTKNMFNRQMTPPGCGPEVARSIAGEAGILLEEMLIGGCVTVVRKDKDYEEGDMDKVKELVLENRGRYRKLTVDHCRVFLASIKTNRLQALPFRSLLPYVHREGFSRFRYFDVLEHQDSKSQDISPPAGMVFYRGLGLRIDKGDEYVLS